MKPMYLATLLAALLALSACEKKEEEKKEEAAIPVELAAVTSGEIEAAYRGTATLEAEDEATVVAKTGGVIEQILVEEGSRVRTGQTLARLETDKLKLELARAQSAADKLKQDNVRNESVMQRNLISREAYERTKFELQAAQAAMDLATLALKESEIRAPFDGVVTARYVKRGNSIQPGAQAFRVTQLDRLQANLHVPERDIHKLKPGHPVLLSVDAWPGKEFSGEVIRVNPVVDAQTGTVKVTAQMAPQAELKPGMFGRVEILYDKRPNAILVDRDAVLVEDAQQSVFVVAEGKARRRAIKTGYSDARNFEVLEGLKSGEQVVTTGQSNLKDDAKVTAVTVGAPAAAPAAPAVAAEKKG